MKKILFTLCFVFSFSFLTSCSVDELDENQSLDSKMSYNIDNENSIMQREGDSVVNDTSRINVPLVTGSEIDPPKPAPKPE